MPRLPKGMFKRGRSYYIRQKIRGKGVWRSLGPDREEAVRKHRLIQSRGGLRALVDGKAEDPSESERAMTVSEVGEKWLGEYVATRRNQKGQRLARDRFEADIKPAIGSLKISGVRPEHLRQLRLRLERRGLSPRTVSHILSDARCLLRYVADELRLIPRSPFPPRLMPRVEEVAPRRLSDEDIERVLMTVPEDHAFIIRLALATGLRWGEIQRLQWRHVDWKSKQLVVERTKSGKVRRVPVTADTLGMLKERFAESKSLFVSPFRKTDPSSFLDFVKRKTGVRAFGFHKLRHTFACRWLDAGGSKEALQQILGHSTIRLTEIYGKLSDISVGLEAERVAQGVAGRPGGGRASRTASRGQVDKLLSHN